METFSFSPLNHFLASPCCSRSLSERSGGDSELRARSGERRLRTGGGRSAAAAAVPEPISAQPCPGEQHHMCLKATQTPEPHLNSGSGARTAQGSGRSGGDGWRDGGMGGCREGGMEGCAARAEPGMRWLRRQSLDSPAPFWHLLTRGEPD